MTKAFQMKSKYSNLLTIRQKDALAEAKAILRKAATKPYNEFKAKVIRVKDGDTLEAELVVYDIGKKITITLAIRLLLCWAFELNDPDPKIKAKAATSRNALARMLPVGKEFYVQAKFTDRNDRLLANVFIGTQRIKSVNQIMVERGHATEIEAVDQIANLTKQ